MVIRHVRPILPALRADDLVLPNAHTARRNIVQLPRRDALVDAVTWLPVFLTVPAIILSSDAPIVLPVILEFFIGCGVLMIIAVCCTYFCLEYYAIQVFYPRLWTDTRHMQSVATLELDSVLRRYKRFQLLAVLVPVSVVIGLVLLGPEHFAMNGYFTFPVLAIVLIVAGSLGLMATGAVRASIERTIRLFTGREE